MYARVVTSYVKPNKLNELTAIYKNELLPLIKHQPGFNSLIVLNDPEANNEISITLWDRIVDMEAFNVNLLAFKDKIATLLAAAPEVEIFQVAVPVTAVAGDTIALTEASLGIRIEDPFATGFGR